jgi:hypothetical protein
VCWLGVDVLTTCFLLLADISAVEEAVSILLDDAKEISVLENILLSYCLKVDEFKIEDPGSIIIDASQKV